MSVKIIICDDDSLIRESLKILLPMKGDIEIVGEASNGEEAFLASKLSLEKINTLVEIYNKI